MSVRDEVFYGLLVGCLYVFCGGFFNGLSSSINTFAEQLAVAVAGLACVALGTDVVLSAVVLHGRVDESV